MAIQSLRLAGFLVWCGDPRRVREDLESSPSIKAPHEVSDRFEQYQYVTPEPIPDYDDPLAEPPFCHELIMCWGHEAFLGLSSNQDIVSHLLEHELTGRFRRPWRHSEIDVDGFVKRRLGALSGISDLPAGPSPLKEYDISRLSARTESYQGFIRSVSFYGDNVVQAALYHQNWKAFACSSCTLRGSGGDVALIGSDGFLSFRLPREPVVQRHRLREILHILAEFRSEDLLFVDPLARGEA
jgi:hypothetical protein